MKKRDKTDFVIKELCKNLSENSTQSELLYAASKEIIKLRAQIKKLENELKYQIDLYEANHG